MRLWCHGLLGWKVEVIEHAVMDKGLVESIHLVLAVMELEIFVAFLQR